jgi:NodT family efflux transporter outer membrane factor (OMF) lipoprotein
MSKEGTIGGMLRVARASLLASLAFGASGCLVGPDHKNPDVALNPAWTGASDPRLAPDSAVQVAWWKSFEDPSLDNLIEAAYHQNLPLQVAGLRIMEARAQLGISKAELLPQNVNPVAQAEAVGLSKHAANTALVDRSYGSYIVGFDAVWEPDFWGKYRRGIMATRALYGASVADYDDALVSLSADVARAYVFIRTYEALLGLAEENVKIQEEGLQIASSRFKNGATSELDVAQATNLLETTRSTIPVLQVNLQQSKNALSTLLGKPTGAVQAMLGPPRQVPVPRVSIGVPAELLRRRPDIRAAELRAIAQCDKIGVAKAQLIPSFSLFGSIGTQTSTGGSAISNNSNLGNLFGSDSLAYNAGAGIFVPLLEYPRLMNAVRVEDARYQELLTDYVNTVLKAAQEVEDGMVGYLKESDSTVFAQNAVTAAQTAVRISLVQYREGAVDFQRVLDSQRSLLEAQNSLTNTRSSAATYLIALYKALGGGWQLREGDNVVTESAKSEMQNRTNWGGYLSGEQRPGQK